jgi:RsiW-degrading membrane proteinase PrsW (M82 family)
MEIFGSSNQFFLGFFESPTAAGILLAIAFGIFWLAPFLPPLHRRYWLWGVMALSAILTLAAVSYVQIPLQLLASQGMLAVWNYDALLSNLLLVGIPAVLLSGLVQESAKMMPMLFYWWGSGRRLSPKQGLVLGAVAGAGFGILEAQWALNSIFNLSSFSASFIGVWERFAVVALHTGVSALAGWGLAKGKGWWLWLAASLIHGLVNYSIVLLQVGLLGVIELEIYISVISAIVLGVMLWLRWRGSSGDDAVVEFVGSPDEASTVTDTD